MPPERQRWLDKLTSGLRKTGSSISQVFTGGQIDDQLYEDLESALLMADTGVKVHVVNPAIIDTDLFHLPDNDATIADMSMALPVEAMVEPVVEQLRSGSFEIYVPEWFQDIVTGKLANPDGFLDGTVAYLRERTAAQ